MSIEYMRKIITLLEAEYVGLVNDPNVKYATDTKKGEISKITANVSSTTSARYTRLANNVKKIKITNNVPQISTSGTDYAILYTIVPYRDANGGFIIQTLTPTTIVPLLKFQRYNTDSSNWSPFIQK